MDLPGKQRRHIIQVHFIRSRKKPVFMLKTGILWRMDVDLEFYFNNLTSGNASRQILIRIKQQKMFFDISFQKSRTDIAFLRLFLLLYRNMQAKSTYLFLQDRKLNGQIKIRGRCYQRKIQIFRETIQPIKNPECRSPIKSRFLKEPRPRKSTQNNLLHDFFHRILLVIYIFYLIVLQHLFNCRIHLFILRNNDAIFFTFPE